MSRMEIKNRDIAGAIDILYTLGLRGTKSRHRTRLLKELEGRLQQVMTEYNTIVREYTNLEKGQEKELKVEMLTDPYQFFLDREELYNEVFTITGENFDYVLESVLESLDECDREWSGKEAEKYFNLCESIIIE